MLRIVDFNGGLGNQMFQYAFYLRLKKKHPLSLFLFDIEQAQQCHHGYELDAFFQIDSQKKSRNYRRVKKYLPKILKSFHVIKQKNSLEYDFSVLSSRRLFLSYQGFWQSEKFFLPVEKEVRNAFVFRTEKLNAMTTALLPCLRSNNSVSVHVRRGDYLLESEKRGLCSLEYYEKAMACIRERVENPLFVFFSDDVDWVKENIKCDNARYVTWNQGKDSWQDMFLMSQCKHNIVANSSFSWWGAWLNQNVGKIVMAPTPWFNDALDYDIMPQGWVAIKR